MTVKSWKEVKVVSVKKQKFKPLWHNFKSFFSKVFYRLCLLCMVLIPGVLYVLGFSLVVTTLVNVLRKDLYSRAAII